MAPLDDGENYHPRCEKPLAPSVAEALAVVEAEVSGGRRLIQLGFMRQYDPQHVLVKEALDRGDIGRLLMFRGVHSNLHNRDNPYFDDVHAVAPREREIGPGFRGLT